MLDALGVRRTLCGVRRDGTGRDVPSADAVRLGGAERACGVDTMLGRSSDIAARHNQPRLWTTWLEFANLQDYYATIALVAMFCTPPQKAAGGDEGRGEGLTSLRTFGTS